MSSATAIIICGGRILTGGWSIIRCGESIIKGGWSILIHVGSIIQCGGDIMSSATAIITCGGRILTGGWSIIKGEQSKTKLLVTHSRADAITPTTAKNMICLFSATESLRRLYED